jgi:hypothetical protein
MNITVEAEGNPFVVFNVITTSPSSPVKVENKIHHPFSWIMGSYF